MVKQTDTGGMTGEEIVISGISGVFPNTENTKQLIHNLYNKVDMVTAETQNTIKHLELPKYFGKIHGLEKFDAPFFRVTPMQADSFDPVGRKILEHAYCAIFDAGINPVTLKGTKLGVFVGSAQSDISTLSLYNALKKNGFIISGCSKTMLANRISYWIDGKGPSYGLDHACAGSIACLEVAYDRLMAGDCDSALVGGCIHSIHPVLSINMKRAGLLCHDGKTKCFDKNGDGYVRSDAINLFFLQKAKDAKRIYTEVYNVRGKFFSKPDALFLPTRKPEDIEQLLNDFYSKTDVLPEAIEYVEANATGIAEADGNELEAIARVFAKDKPIKVGCIKSNMGHTQAVSGACSLTKICLSYQRGEIPANLHYNEPQDQITAVREGKVQVVTENTPFGRSFTALNNFSHHGANYHVLLKGHFKPKDTEKYRSTIPRLILASGRQDQSVNKILDFLENKPIDAEEIALLNNIFKHNIPGHTGRGYTVIEPIDNKKTASLGRGFEYYSGNVRPVWFLYSGMGSQWMSMGTDLMRLPIFAAAIERCNKVLQPKGLDIVKIITTNDSTIFDNILNSFVGITAIQIGLTDILKSIGIKPDNIIGHSVGEISCAYADDCLTTEETILASYYRGIVSLETTFIRGQMAAIGLGHKEVSALCPPEIDIACKNSAQSTTISGPADIVDKFLEFLNSRSIFAKAVSCSNIAYHSRYIAIAGPKLLTVLRKILKNPKVRSSKWLTTCFLPSQWDTDICKTASPEYFTHNLLSTVHFYDTAKLIPDDAIVIEIAPHGLMQAIMKRSHVNCLNISLTRRNEKNNVLLMLKAIGTLYQAGLNPDVDVLYPTIDFPVSTETPVISHLVDWEHSKIWMKDDYNVEDKKKVHSFEFNMSIHDDEYSYVKGYTRNGVNIFPEAGILFIVWKTVAMYKNTNYQNLSIVFENVKFHHEVRLQSEEVLRLRTHVQPGSNLFEVTHCDSLVTSGSIQVGVQKGTHYNVSPFNDSDDHLRVSDIYKLMSLRGYSYGNKFQSIQSTNIERNKALLKWENDWILFLDALFQLNALSRDYEGVSAVKFINKLSINPAAHEKEIRTAKNNNICYNAQIFDNIDVCKSGGVVIRSIVFTSIPLLKHATNKLLIRKTFAHSPQISIDITTVLQINLQVVSRVISNKICIKEVQGNNPPLSLVVQKINDEFPLLNIEVNTVRDIEDILTSTGLVKTDVLIMYDLLNDKKILQKITNTVNNIFIMTIENQSNQLNIPNNFKEITKYKVADKVIVLILKNSSNTAKVTTVAEVKNGNYYLPVEIKSKFQNVKLVSNDVNTYIWAELLPQNHAIQVAYAGVSLHKQSNENLNKFGMDFSGIDTNGCRVMGLAPDNSISSVVLTYPELLWPVPQHWSLEDAASVPLAYVHAYYCLAIRASLKKRKTVFVSNGDTGFGQAVISICISFDCTIFTTVRNIETKKFLMRIFPELDVNKIGCSSDDSFLHMVQTATKNKRCDIVINDNTGLLREAATNCVGIFKTFLDVCTNDMEENENFSMANVNEDRVYKAVCFSNIFLKDKCKDRKLLQWMVSDGIAKGIVRPLTRVVYIPSEICNAFKLLSNKNHSGRVLVNMKHLDVLKNVSKVLPRIQLSPSNLFIIVCDGSELGVQLIDHLIQRGARQFLIHLKPKLINGYFHVKYASWKKYNVVINFNTDDLSTKSGCENLFSHGTKLGCVDGIFITHNEVSEDMSIIDDDKVDHAFITASLDLASRKINNLSYFAVLSLTTRSLLEENEFLNIEKYCLTRSDIGLPALLLRYIMNGKTIGPQTSSRFFNALDTGLKQNYASVMSSDDTEAAEIACKEEKAHGFGVFFRVIDTESSAIEPIICMETKLNYENESELYIDPDDDYLIIVPGFDGSYKTMNDISERLKIPAMTLQLEADIDCSIPQIANRMKELIKARFHSKSKFYLFGYSFGVNVVLELAALLEKEGKTGVVFCLDSSPDALRTHLDAHLGDITDQQLQNSLIEHIYYLLTGKTSTELNEKLKSIEAWPEKISSFINIAKNSVSYTHAFLRSFVHVAYSRIVLAKEYEPDFKLASKLVLIKGYPNSRSRELSNDYGLSKYSNESVDVFDIEADHATAPQDCRVSNIVNKMLDPVLLSEFEKKNLCQYFFA